MPLSQTILTEIENAFVDIDKQIVQHQRETLTQNYREQRSLSGPLINNAHARLSYLATRLPATYAVCEKVFGILVDYDLNITSLLDLGAGPGTASLCANALLPTLKTLTLIDQDKDFKEFADLFLKQIPSTYHLQNITQMESFSRHDLVTLSYALNELSDKNAHDVVQKAWQATQSTLIIMEPGTPKAFKRLKALRAALIKQGAHILAPCPHNAACPLETDDWCHFSVRLERTPLHQHIKQAPLNYEDEKFCYLIAVRDKNLRAPSARLIKKPLKRPGHTLFDLCTSTGLQRETLSKKDKAAYKTAQKLTWGDPFPLKGIQK